MKHMYNQEKDELRFTFTNLEMGLFNDFFVEKYLPISEDRFFTQQQFSILSGVAKRCRVMTVKNSRQNKYPLTFNRHEAVSLLYVISNVLDDCNPLMMSFAAPLNDVLHSYLQRLFFNSYKDQYSLASATQNKLSE